MTRLAGSLLVFFSLHAFASFPEDMASVSVDTVEFFKARLGKYKIELHGGTAPHANSVGRVEDLSDEALITMGYCPDNGSGFCDIGYRDCPYESTTVTETVLSDERRLYKIAATYEDKTSVYEWEEQGDKVWFRSINYLLNGEVIPVLEHVVTKIP